MIEVHFIRMGKISDNSLRQILYPKRGEPQTHALQAFEDNFYEHVASVDTDDLEDAWGKIQNVRTSWSESPPPGVKPQNLPDPKLDQAFGHRSAMVGDIFILNGVKHVVAACGFEKL